MGGCGNSDLLGWLSQPPGQSSGKLEVVQGSPAFEVSPSGGRRAAKPTQCQWVYGGLSLEWTEMAEELLGKGTGLWESPA